MRDGAGWHEWWRPGLALGVAAVLLCLGAANILLRAGWHEVEDGVLWVSRPEGVVAEEVVPGGPAAGAGIRQGDVLLAIDGVSVGRPVDVFERLHGGEPGTTLFYTVLRLGARELREVSLAPVPQGNRALYFVLAAVAIFTLLVGLSVRLRRPGDPSTLHFFWLCVALFGVFAFSFSGRLDRLDWVFFWADIVSIVLLPPLFVHFSLVFPERPQAWIRTSAGRAILPAIYLPALVLGGGRVVLFTQTPVAPYLQGALELFDRLELVYLSVGLTAGLAIWVRVLSRSRSVTTRRQLRWIIGGTGVGAVPFVVTYAMPFALGWEPLPSMELTAIPLGLVPLAFASAITRYRLMDVEVIIKRALVYTAALSAIVAMYAVLLRLASVLFLGGSQQINSVIAVLATLVVVLLARPVKDAIQDTLDRAYYRDRYDYRRALVGFARDLNSDLEIERLSERLVARVKETLLVDRIALMLGPPDDEVHGEAFTAIRADGFEYDEQPSPLALESGVGSRVCQGHVVALDDPHVASRLDEPEVDAWRDEGIYYFVPCIYKKSTSAVIALGRRDRIEPLNSEDLALLTAVAGQVATALENGRLYQRLRTKADELHRMREFSENVIESLHDGLVVVDLEERVVRWNHQVERIYGVPAQTAIGRSLDGLFPAAFVQAVRGGQPDAKAAGARRVALVTRHDPPRHVLVTMATAPLRTPDGRVGTVVLLEDVTSRAQLEEQLQISEKMASVGLLAAGVAHEVNTPLTGISSFTQMLLDGADRESAEAKLLEKIERQTFRASKIVNGLLHLARPPRVETGVVDLNAVITDVLSLLEHQLKTANIQVRREFEPNLPSVAGAEHKLQQVFLNLCINAKDAMRKGGWLSISSRLSAADEQVVVEVADTGSGIRHEDLSRIYDPFFTTKDIGQGTGLGLAITYGIVQEHDGTIACHSTPGQGTRFVLTLPAAGSRVIGAGHAAT